MDKRLLRSIEHLKFNAKILKPGEHLFRQGEYLSSVYTVRSGSLKSYTIKENGDEYVMGFNFPAQILGLDAFSKKKSLNSLIALEQSNICEISIDHFKQIVQSNPDIQQQIFHLIAKKINVSNEILLRTTATQRVAKFMLNLSKHYTRQGYPYYLIKTVMTHHDIANYLRIAPETLSRLLRKMQQDKIIRVNKRNIYLNEITELQAMSDE